MFGPMLGVTPVRLGAALYVYAAPLATPSAVDWSETTPLAALAATGAIKRTYGNRQDERTKEEK